MQFLFKTGAEKFFAFTASVLTSVESKAKIFTAAGATEAAGAAWAEPAAGAEGAATEAVETTFDLLQLILSIGLGVGAGVIVGLVIVAVCRFAGKHHPYLKPFFEACARPLTALCLVLGATIGFRTLESVKDAANPGWFTTVEHLFLILLIAAGTWLVVGAVNGAVELIHNRMLESSERRAARVRTQTQILHRVIVVVIWVLGFAGILLTFPSARAAGASLLASAGLVSVVAGLAAQTTLGNVFAGLQLAFSDSIRVGDIVHYKGNYTTVEEITLTYVVLAVWDGRRIIVPSSLMTTEPFENWTRRKPDMIGEVTWEVDWSLPIEAARKEFMHLLNNTDLWDGKTGVLSINDATANALILRAVVSAEDSATLTDLKYYLREKMVLWIQREAQQAIPHQRYGEYPPVNIAESQQITNGILEERLQREQPVVFMPKGSQDRGGVFSEKDSTAVITLTELKKLGVVSEDSAAAKSALRDNGKSPQNQDQDDTQKISQVPVRYGINDDVRDEAHDTAQEDRERIPQLDQTIVMPRVSGISRDGFTENSAEQSGVKSENQTKQIRKITDTGVREGHESSLFSGSPEAEERKKEFSGPGDDVYEERNRKIAQTNASGEIHPVKVHGDGSAAEVQNPGSEANTERNEVQESKETLK